MQGFVRCNFCFVLQGETDIVQPVEQAMAHEIVDRELRREAAIVMQDVYKRQPLEW